MGQRVFVLKNVLLCLLTWCSSDLPLDMFFFFIIIFVQGKNAERKWITFPPWKTSLAFHYVGHVFLSGSPIDHFIQSVGSESFSFLGTLFSLKGNTTVVCFWGVPGTEKRRQLGKGNHSWVLFWTQTNISATVLFRQSRNPGRRVICLRSQTVRCE